MAEAFSMAGIFSRRSFTESMRGMMDQLGDDAFLLVKGGRGKLIL
jgi:hypothetical protein